MHYMPLCSARSFHGCSVMDIPKQSLPRSAACLWAQLKRTTTDAGVWGSVLVVSVAGSSSRKRMASTETIAWRRPQPCPPTAPGPPSHLCRHHTAHGGCTHAGLLNLPERERERGCYLIMYRIILMKRWKSKSWCWAASSKARKKDQISTGMRPLCKVIFTVMAVCYVDVVVAICCNPLIPSASLIIGIVHKYLMKQLNN